MADQRNFRSTYLGKVGIKGVEEKKSIEILLAEQPYDLNKLTQFCHRFPVPASYRLEVWKILLGVVPPYQEIQDFVMQQRREQYKDLYDAVVSMGRGTMSLPQLHLRMFLIQETMLPFGDETLAQNPENETFVAISTAMSDVLDSDDPVVIYWVTFKFFMLQQKLAAKHHNSVKLERVEQFLAKEDAALHQHLVGLQVFSHLPCSKWVSHCFAGVLPPCSLERLWDKLMGRSWKILLYVVVSILVTFKRTLLGMKTTKDICKYLSKIPEDNGDIIVTKAIELWQKHGSSSKAQTLLLM